MNFPPLSKKQTLIILGILSAIALCLRLWGLSDLWINPDEGIYFQIATRSSPVSVLQATAAHAHPPLFYLLLWIAEKISSELTFLRLISVLCGTMTVPTIYLMLKELVRPWAALSASALVAIAPGHIILSQTMRPYALFLMILPLVVLGLLQAFHQDNPEKPLRIFSYSLCTLLFIHYASFIVLFASFTSILIVFVFSPHQRAKWKSFARTIYPLGVAFLAVMAVNFQFALGHGMIRSLSKSDWLLPLYIGNPVDFIQNLSGLLAYVFGESTSCILFAAAIAGMLFTLCKSPIFAAVIAAPFCISATLSWLRLYPFGGSRHSIFLAIYFLLSLAAPFLSDKEKTEESQSGIREFVFAGLFLIVGAATSLYTYPPDITHPPAWEQIVSLDEIDRLQDEIQKTTPKQSIFCDQQTFQLLTPALRKDRSDIVLADHTLKVLSTYRFNTIDELYDDLTNELNETSLVLLSRWGRTGIINETEHRLNDSRNAKLIFKGRNIALFEIAPAAISALKTFSSSEESS